MEKRQLLAAGTALVASTPDALGNPVSFSVDSGGVVDVNLIRPTNDSLSPFLRTGVQPLSAAIVAPAGTSQLKASAIAAFTDAAGEPAVAAIDSATHYVLVNRYTTTGGSATPQAWTGWESLGDFAASKLIAANNGVSGAALFVIGGDGNIYENAYSPTFRSTSLTSTWSDFQLLPGLPGGQISATADGTGAYEVVGIVGPMSNVYAARTTVTAGTISSAPFQPISGFVASSVAISPGLNQSATGDDLGDRLFLSEVGADAKLYLNILTSDLTGNRVSSGDLVLGGYLRPFTGVTAVEPALVSGGTLRVFVIADPNNDVYSNIFSATGPAVSDLVSDGIQNLTYHYVEGEPHAYSAADVVPESTTDGGVQVLGADLGGVAHLQTGSSFPSFTQNSSIGVGSYYFDPTTLDTLNYHPLATATSANGLPAVATLRSDGTVDINLVTVQRTDTDTDDDSYNGFFTLTGLKATSIALAQQTNGLAIFALTGERSYVYENDFVATGNATTPYAWTGWRRLGDFVATAINATTVTLGVDQGTPTLFALGTNGLVYATDNTVQSSGSGSDSDPDSLAPATATFTPLTGLAATAFSVRSLGSTILVAALTGGTSYAYATQYDPAMALSTTPAAWTQVGTYVLSRITASISTSGRPVVAGISPYGFLAVSLSVDGSTAPTASPDNFTPINFTDGLGSYGNLATSGTLTNLIAIPLGGAAETDYGANYLGSIINPMNLLGIARASDPAGAETGKFDYAGGLAQTFAAMNGPLPAQVTPVYLFTVTNSGDLVVIRATTGSSLNTYKYQEGVIIAKLPGS